MDFLRGGPIFGEKKREPEPERTGTGWTEPGVQRSGYEPNRTEPNRGLPDKISIDSCGQISKKHWSGSDSLFRDKRYYR